MDEETKKIEKKLIEKLKKMGVSDKQIRYILDDARKKCNDMAKIAVEKNYH